MTEDRELIEKLWWICEGKKMNRITISSVNKELVSKDITLMGWLDNNIDIKYRDGYYPPLFRDEITDKLFIIEKEDDSDKKFIAYVSGDIKSALFDDYDYRMKQRYTSLCHDEAFDIPERDRTLEIESIADHFQSSAGDLSAIKTKSYDDTMNKIKCYDDAEKYYHDDYSVGGEEEMPKIFDKEMIEKVIIKDGKESKYGIKSDGSVRKIMTGLEFWRMKAEFDCFINDQMIFLKEVTKKLVDDEISATSIETFIQSIWDRIENKFREWCHKLTE